MSLVGLQLLVVGELDIHGSSSQLGHAAGEVRDHGGSGHFISHLQERLKHAAQQIFTVSTLNYDFLFLPEMGQLNA
jgi:hypothetical protein